MSEYPKRLYGPRGWNDLDDFRRCLNAAEENEARDAGYKTLPELPHPDNAGKVDPKTAPQVSVPALQAVSAAPDAPAATPAATLPDGWRDLAWPALRALALKNGARATGLNRDAAVAFLEAKS